MKNLKSLLEAADPLRDEPTLAASDARVLRNRMLAAIDNTPARFFPAALQVAAVVVVMLVVGTVAGQRLALREPQSRQASGDGAGQPLGAERRQVQFATPGGTRIIWTIDPDFQLKEVMP